MAEAAGPVAVDEELHGVDRRQGRSQRVVVAAAWLVVVVAVVFILKVLAILLQPLFIALFLFHLGEPVRRLLVARGLRRSLAVVLVSLVVMAAIFGAAALFSAYAAELRSLLPLYKSRLQDMQAELLDWLSAHPEIGGEQIRAIVAEEISPMKSFPAAARALVHALGQSASAAFLVLLYLVFLSIEATTFPQRLELAFGAAGKRRVSEAAGRISASILRYVWVKGLAAALVGALSTAALVFYGVDLPFFWGLLVFVGHFIPYVGAALALIPPALLALLQTGSLTQGLLVAATIFGFHVLVGSYLEPLFTGHQLDLSPLVVLLSLAFWGWLWGFVGLLLAVPITSSLRLVLETLPITREAAILMGAPRRRGDPVVPAAAGASPAPAPPPA